MPDEGDLTPDTVAHVERLDQGGVPWAWLIEFQTEPDHLMFARGLGYLPNIWKDEKPDANPGSRFKLGVTIVNLTKRGDSSQEYTWPETGFVLNYKPNEWNLSEEDAEQHLQLVEAGELSRLVLPFIVLMQGADNPDIIPRWIAQAQAEPIDHRRGDLGALTVVLAELVDWTDLWKAALKGWNMKTSQQVQEWQQEAEAIGIQKGTVSALLKVLQGRWGALPKDLVNSIESQTEISVLDQWLTDVAEANSLDEFRQATNQ